MRNSLSVSRMINMLSEKQVETVQKITLRKDEQYVSAFFQAIGDVTRLRIMRILAKSRAEDLCVTDLARIIDCSLPVISQHMRVLESCNIVEKHRRGKMTCYKLNLSNPLVKDITPIINN